MLVMRRPCIRLTLQTNDAYSSGCVQTHPELYRGEIIRIIYVKLSCVHIFPTNLSFCMNIAFDDCVQKA